MLSLSEAQAAILNHVVRLPGQAYPLLQSLHRVMAQDIYSPAPSPLFTNSAMDGYALALEEPWELPLHYRVVSVLPAGQVAQEPVMSGAALRIMTGAPLPEGADTVVPLEHTETLPDGRIRVLKLKASGQNVRHRGEDFSIGALLIPVGQELTPGAIGLLAGVGVTEVPVIPAPRIAIVSTGDELVDIHEIPQGGQLRNSNSYTIAAAIAEVGAVPWMLGIARDTPAAIKAKLQIALKADAIVTLGGVSVGDYDYVQPVLLELGFQKIFWKVAIKPGKPFLFGTWEQKPVFGLPGNPGSALTVFEQLIRPALRKMMGHTLLWRPLVQARLSEPIRKNDDRLHLLRAMVEKEEGSYRAKPLPHQGSGDLLIVSQANAIIVAEREYATGEWVSVQLLHQAEDH